jgi:hypothetical protein
MNWASSVIADLDFCENRRHRSIQFVFTPIEFQTMSVLPYFLAYDALSSPLADLLSMSS